MPNPEQQTAFTDHAIDRWIERFPDDDVLAAFARSRPVKLWRLRMEASRTGRPFRFSHNARYLRDEETGAVFILRQFTPHHPETVVTVVKFRRPKVCRPPAFKQRGKW